MNSQITAPEAILVIGLVLYMGLCFGLIAQKHGKNPLLYGLLSMISPFNLIILGMWAFGKFESDKAKTLPE